MSRFEPKNREEAFAYQFKEDVRCIHAAALCGEDEFEKALNRLEANIAAYRNKYLKKRAQKTLKISNERLAIAKQKYPSLYSKK